MPLGFKGSFPIWLVVAIMMCPIIYCVVQCERKVSALVDKMQALEIEHQLVSSQLSVLKDDHVALEKKIDGVSLKEIIFKRKK